MKSLLLAVVFLATPLVAQTSGIDGVWVSERNVGDVDGKTYTHTTTITLKSADGVLTGTMVQVSAAPWMKQITGRSLEILDGKIEGAAFSFKVKMEAMHGERTATYAGNLEGDQLTGTTKYRGIGITDPFKAHRDK